MTTTLSQLSIGNAPRDPEGLSAIGRFRIRRLAEELGLLDDPARKEAFITSDMPTMVQTVLQGLKMYDASHKNGVTAHEPAAPPEQEAAPAEEAPARQPRVTRKQEAAVPVTTAAAALTGGALPGSEAMGALAAALKTAQADVEAIRETTTGNAKDLEQVRKQLGQIEKKVDLALTMQEFVFALSLTLGEQVLGAGREDILNAINEDRENIAKTLEKLLGGQNAGKAVR